MPIRAIPPVLASIVAVPIVVQALDPHAPALMQGIAQQASIDLVHAHEPIPAVVSPPGTSYGAGGSGDVTIRPLTGAVTITGLAPAVTGLAPTS